MADIGEIREIAERFIEGTDMFIVDVKSSPGDIFEVVIDSDSSVSIDDCVELARLINGGFDKDADDFELTVSSFGIGRPLEMPRQYRKIVGKTVEVVLKDGRKIEGVLTSATEGDITVAFEEMQAVEGKKRKQAVGVERTIPLDGIKTTKLKVDFR